MTHLPCDHEPQSSINTTRIPKYNVKQSLPSNHEPHSSIKSTRIPKYNVKRSFSLTCATTFLNLCFMSSFEIQSQFSTQNVFRHDLKHLPSNHEPHSSVKSTRIPKYNVKWSIQSRFSIHNVFRHDLTHLPCDHEPLSSIKSTRVPKYNTKRSV
ncbi:uncharacterized protein G2W53_040308 [Senna tora]|uniref:Uncharacterized protein n=1 Tax=Senna tora TaxID=362788 RepID=A0A834W3G1_9FABA|nr:uncharacterized protein G2W53_040308 [Senna tora]